MALKDGEIQAAMIGDGLTAASENILLDASGFILHDMSGASIITPTFGVGLIQNLLGSTSEAFTSWLKHGTATATANTVAGPDGDPVNFTADTINLPAVGDYLYRSTADATNGVPGMFSVWLKADSAGTVLLRVTQGAAHTDLRVAVETSWKRFNLPFTTTADASFIPKIMRETADDLSSVYAFGASASTHVSSPIPFSPFPSSNNTYPEAGTVIRGPLFISKIGNPSMVVVGNSWTIVPTGNYGSFFGFRAGSESNGDGVTAVGYEAGKGNIYDDVILLGFRSSATGNKQFVAGDTDSNIADVFFGSGVADSAPVGYTIHGSGGDGANIAGAALNLAGGKGTGSGAGGAVVLQTAPAGSSGSSQNSLVDRLTVGEDGTIDFHNNPITNWSGPSGSGSVTRWRLSFGA